MKRGKKGECCKSRLRKQGLKPSNTSCGISNSSFCCKSRLRKQGLKLELPRIMSIICDLLQKPSTKTRIETFSHQCHLTNICQVAKAVYENKDWNLWMQVIFFRISDSCKSRLRKQGLKHSAERFSNKCFFELQKPSTKTRIETITSSSSNVPQLPVAKAVYENKDWNICTFVFSDCFSDSCKSRLRKQGLKQFAFSHFCGFCAQVAKAVYENKDWNKIILPLSDLK